MHIMNFTQPNFHNERYFNNQRNLRGHNQSNLSFNESDLHLILTQQIHKVPESIKKPIRLGKHKRQIFRIQNPEKQRYNVTGMDYEQKDQNLLKNFHINTRKISNLSSKDPQGLSIEDFIRKQKQKNSKFLADVGTDFRSRLIKQAQKKISLTTKRQIENKRKLSPLRRGSLIVQKKIQRKLLQITFLNIEKARLLKMYENVNQQENSAEEQKFASNQSVIETNFHKTITKQQFKQMSETSGFQVKRRKNLSEDIALNPTLMRLRKFVIPFQRYHYRDFIWKVAFSNHILLECPKQYENKFKVYIGRGNNSLLVKSLLKRRASWWIFTEKYEEANLVWTQIKINDVFNNQQKSKVKSQPWNYVQNHTDFKNKSTYLQNKKILNETQIQIIQEYMSKHRKVQQKLDGTMARRNKMMKKYSLQRLEIAGIKIHNHLPNNYIIGNKKALYYTMTNYYQKIGENPFQFLPQTYHIQKGLEDEQYTKFLNSFYPRQKKASKQERQKSPVRQRTKNIWIVKPGEFTNRGNGINVCLNLEEIKAILKNKQKLQNGNSRTYIIQSYIDKPFLYQRRKFDIRHYMMITSVNGLVKGYWYQYGYIRTTSYQYSVKTNFSSIHLTNDAVQKNLPDYGKYEKGNKLTYQIFQSYLDRQYPGKYNFFEQIYPKMKKIARDAIRASSLVIDPDRKNHNFQVFGMDFMIDNNFKPWLIQINNNPCLELSCPILAQIIPTMVQNALKISVDSLIPPPASFDQKRPKFSDNVSLSNKFQLVYDSATQQAEIRKIFNGSGLSDDVRDLQDQADQVFQDDGNQLED